MGCDSPETVRAGRCQGKRALLDGSATGKEWGRGFTWLSIAQESGPESGLEAAPASQVPPGGRDQWRSFSFLVMA